MAFLNKMYNKLADINTSKTNMFYPILQTTMAGRGGGKMVNFEMLNHCVNKQSKINNKTKQISVESTYTNVNARIFRSQFFLHKN